MRNNDGYQVVNECLKDLLRDRAFLMKAFISNVDTAIGHNLSRLLSLTPVGSRNEENEEEEDDAKKEVEDGKNESTEGKPKDKYVITGTLLYSETPLQFQIPKMVESGDKKKDASRRLAIEKYAIPNSKPNWVAETINGKDTEVLSRTLLDSDIIVFDLLDSLQEASQAVSCMQCFILDLADPNTQIATPKVFVAISTIMTWAKTKIENEEAEALVEDEYRRRKAHPNFKAHLALEKEIVKLGSKKSNLKTFVIAAGMIYHGGDSLFHYLFKAAWHNEKELLCYGKGGNFLPCIHLDDLTNIVVQVVDTAPESAYIVAVDDSKVTLEDITKAIANSLGSGKTKHVNSEEAFLDKNISQSNYDMITCNLKIDAAKVKEFSLKWKYESGMVENIASLIQEYVDARAIWPIKVLIHGPPASRKTTFALKLAEHYQIHYVNPNSAMSDLIQKLETSAATAGGEDEAETAEADQEQLAELREAEKEGFTAAQYLTAVKEKLKSMPCKNQGYVLDGYPFLFDEAAEIFKASDETKDEMLPYDDLLAPNFIFSLEASDQFIKQKIQKLPELAVVNTKNTEDALTKRLEEFRKVNLDENTMLNFFDEAELHPIILNLESIDFDGVFELMIKSIGSPRNYGPGIEILLERRRQIEEKKTAAEQLAREERIKRENEEVERHEKAMANWTAKLEEIRKQEKEVLQTQSLPLRKYLMQHVIPTLTAGLIEVAKIRPEDPIDYLAEFMFKQNAANQP